jgi:hypothetical protein
LFCGRDSYGAAPSVIIHGGRLDLPKEQGTKENENMIDGTVLAAMKKNAVLVNVGRGTLVDETALLAAAKSGHLCGAGLSPALLALAQQVRTEQPRMPFVHGRHGLFTGTTRAQKRVDLVPRLHFDGVRNHFSQ